MQRRINLKCPFFTFFLCVSTLSFAQVKPILTDTVYQENIQTVQITPTGDPLSMPIVRLNVGSVSLAFDDLDGDIKDFLYTIEQCDREWRPSKLDKNEYLEGFQEDRVRNFKNSFTTNIPYVNYEVTVPNEFMRLTKSGNYVIKIMQDNPERTPILTRRFVVFEQILVPAPVLTYATPLKYNTHQELDFNIELKNFRVQNPMNDIRVTVLQNGRWDIAEHLIAPTFTQGERLVFDYQDSIIFSAGKEWRYVDLRSTRFRSERVLSIDKGDDTWDFRLRTDLDRGREPYLVYPDINGRFYIQTTDFDGELESNVRADYVDVSFSLLKKEPVEEADVYIYGALSNWELKEEFRLEYDEVKRLYQTTVQLKQGFYNYMYAVVPKKTGRYDISQLEGDWFESENEYDFLVYYRPFGARHDRIIGFSKFNSNKR